MELKTLNCPQCGASIEAEDGIDTFFCKHCGNKIVISGQSDAAYNAKVRIQENLLKYENEKERRIAAKETLMPLAIKLLLFSLIGSALLFIILIVGVIIAFKAEGAL